MRQVVVKKTHSGERKWAALENETGQTKQAHWIESKDHSCFWGGRIQHSGRGDQNLGKGVGHMPSLGGRKEMGYEGIRTLHLAGTENPPIILTAASPAPRPILGIGTQEILLMECCLFSECCCLIKKMNQSMNTILILGEGQKNNLAMVLM